jgi:hypothetical protein
VDYHYSSKHKELSEQLTTWWRTQTDFKTKKALAGLLKVHPDTLGDYFSGRKFPKSDIANRLFELTNIVCLKPRADANPLSETVPQESSPMPLLLPAPGVTASIEKPQEPDIRGLTGVVEEEGRLGKIPEVIARQPPEESAKQGGRYKEEPVVISLQRTSCPFCAHDIAKFGSCVYCGQHFVWAHVPIGQDESL